MKKLFYLMGLAILSLSLLRLQGQSPPIQFKKISQNSTKIHQQQKQGHWL